jgi:hypothetical protein
MVLGSHYPADKSDDVTNGTARARNVFHDPTTGATTMILTIDAA